MTYPLPTSQQMSDLFGMWKYVNDVSGGIFTPLIMLAIFVIMFVGGLMAGARASRVWTFASFLCTIIIIVFTLTDMINKNYIYLGILLIGLGVVWIKLQDTFD